MPTLWRLVRFALVAGLLVWAGIYALATFVTPEPRDITVVVPAERYAR